MKLILGDCLEVMATLAENSVDSIVADPPYGLGFMGKHWDHGVPSVEIWREAFRVLKPGGHLLSFGGTRTYHRMAVAIEDAGFDIRDQLGWAYGSGFPKSHNQDGDWDGWGTALKPAWEPIVMARKPLIGTVAANLAAHRTGALNIDGCRVESGETITTHSRGARTSFPKRATEITAEESGRVTPQNRIVENPRSGRWPANLIHDGSEEVLAAFPAQAGAAAPVHKRNGDKFRTAYGTFPGNVDEGGSTFHGDSGSAARFFYCAKASTEDRDDGLAAFEVRQHVAFATANGTSGKASSISEGRDTRRRNVHPTVKPTELMRWLCRLVTPPGGTVLDPFMGSGSTGRGAVLEGFDFVGIEKEAEYLALAEARIAAAQAQRVEDTRQLGLFA